MTPTRARLRHMPALLAILWAHTRAPDQTAPAQPIVARPRRADIVLMARIILRRWVWISFDDTGPAGFLARDGARVHALYVHPRAQRRGHGSALLRHAKSAIPTGDWLELWTLQDNAPARAFYAAHGFDVARFGTGMGNDENLPDLHLVWQAKAAA